MLPMSNRVPHPSKKSEVFLNHLGGVLFIAIVFVVVNLIVDLLYGWLDPRIRMEG